MEVKVLGEWGYKKALFGLGFSFGTTSDMTYEDFIADKDLVRKVEAAAHRCHARGGTHRKFLRTMHVAIHVKAPRFWWQEADTYVVGTTKQSESTMHTIKKRKLCRKDFEYPLPDRMIEALNEIITYGDLGLIKNALPEGFLQARVWEVSYQALGHMVAQRRSHRLLQWQFFVDQVLAQVKHPEFIDMEASE